MTGSTVGILDRLVGVILLEPGFRVAVAIEADGIHAVLHHAGEVGSVCIVATAALPAGERLVHVLAFQRLLGLRMAGVAKVGALGDEKLLLGRSVRFVAGQATLAIGHSLVLEKVGCRFRRMTDLAEIVAFLHQQLCLL